MSIQFTPDTPATRRAFNRLAREKMELALAVGKKLYDKRQDMAKRDAKREMERALKDRNR